MTDVNESAIIRAKTIGGFWKGMRYGAVAGGVAAIGMTGAGALLGIMSITKVMGVSLTAGMGVGALGLNPIAAGITGGHSMWIGPVLGLLSVGAGLATVGTGLALLPAAGTVLAGMAVMSVVGGLIGGAIGAYREYTQSPEAINAAYEQAQARENRTIKSDLQYQQRQQQVDMKKAQLEAQASQLAGMPGAENGFSPSNTIPYGNKNPAASRGPGLKN